jgi:hypothetical protein
MMAEKTCKVNILQVCAPGTPSQPQSAHAPQQPESTPWSILGSVRVPPRPILHSVTPLRGQRQKLSTEEITMQFQFNGVYYSFTNTQLIVTALVIVVVVVIAVAAYVEHRKKRTLALRNRFGSEYDREVLKHSTSRQAEAKLADRQTHVETLKIRDLGATERERFMTEWYTVQSRFVDHPKTAVTEADDLINALLEARGYPQASFEQRAADVSVTYPRVMENYRVAHAIAVRLGKVEATTEELRTAMVKYRDVFDELVQPQTPHHEVTAA